MTRDELRTADLFVDTGGFFASLVTEDPHHAWARSALQAAVAGRLRVVTTNFVLAETHALLLSRQGRSVALDFIQRLQRSSMTIERVTAADESEALRILGQYRDKDFSYTDAVSFAVMQRLGITVALAFDRHFVQYGFQQARA